jgi:serine/threonine protein phosphatase PrpC
MPLILRYAVRSDLGLVRSNNEDSVYAGPRLLAIADGMGGHAAGEVASKIVIGTLEPLDEDRAIGDLVGTLRNTVLEANRRIAEAVKGQSDLEGMGTTLTALRFAGDQLGLVHVGDSRAYLLRDNLLAQITHDDTYVQYLVDSGKLTPDEAKDHPRKSVILRALLGSDVDPDVSVRDALEGDRYLLCTDGLSDVVSTETLSETLRIPDAQEAADRLVELALRGGGPDNVTVIVADVVRAGPGDFGDGVPVIAGAFVDPAGQEVPGADSAASRAAEMTRTRPAAPVAVAPSAEDERRSRRRRLRRWWWWLAAALVVIVGGLTGTYAITQNYYFVGRSGADVAIYRGINTRIGPLKFYSVHEHTQLRIADLNPSARSQVSDGITADNKRDAEQIVQNLNLQLLPLCVTPTPTQSVTPSHSPTHAGATATTHASRPATAKTSARPTSGTTSTRASASTSALSTSPALSPTESAPSSPGSSSSSSATPECRSGS